MIRLISLPLNNDRTPLQHHNNNSIASPNRWQITALWAGVLALLIMPVFRMGNQSPSRGLKVGNLCLPPLLGFLNSIVSRFHWGSGIFKPSHYKKGRIEMCLHWNRSISICRENSNPILVTRCWKNQTQLGEKFPKQNHLSVWWPYYIKRLIFLTRTAKGLDSI
jgi:uncharacterized integral membrane protein